MNDSPDSGLIRGGNSMPRPYSGDLRERAIEEVRSGASRREVAEHFDVSPSSVINWVRRWRETGSAAAKPSGGSVSRLENYAKWFLKLIAAQPDLTLDEVVVAKNAAGIPGSRSAVGRFFLRHNISFKKKPVRCRTASSGRGPCTPALDSRAGFA
jgi:transposase